MIMNAIICETCRIDSLLSIALLSVRPGAGEFLSHPVNRHGEAVAYLHPRGLRSPEPIEHMRIGYAPGGYLRAWLTQLGYAIPTLPQAGLVSVVGYDTYMHRIVFSIPKVASL
jgi:DNA primase